MTTKTKNLLLAVLSIAALSTFFIVPGADWHKLIIFIILAIANVIRFVVAYFKSPTEQ